MSSPDRLELVRNAIAFLADPKAQASPLAQRIQFLEAKGLTPPEIDTALKQASLETPYQPSYGPAYPQPQYSLISPALPHRWDWRDYFITAVVSGSVTYGAVALFRKYFLPHLQPPNTTAYEDDRDALTAQFDAAEALLKEIQAESAAVRIAVEEQKEKIDKTTSAVESAVTEMRDGEIKTRNEMREVREEVNNIREMLPKMIEKNKESQTQSLAELQQELKSLKALLLSRGPTALPPSPLPALGRPSIPSWQLPSNEQSNTPSVTAPPLSKPPIPSWQLSTSEQSSSTTSATSPLPLAKPSIPSWQLPSNEQLTATPSTTSSPLDTTPVVSNGKGKGKEVEVNEEL